MKKQPDPQPASMPVCNKLECLGEFLEGYTKNIQAEQHCYLELFARPQGVICKKTGAFIPSPAWRAIDLKAKFSRYIVALHKTVADYDFSDLSKKALVFKENIIHDHTLHRIFDSIPRSQSILCIADPPGYRCMRWTTMKKIINCSKDWQGHRMDMLLLLPVEAALIKNITRPECRRSITRFFGSNAWETVRDEIISGQTPGYRAPNKLAQIYITNLKNMGYRYVEGLNPARPRHTSLYYIVWASDRQNRLKTIKNIWSKPRFLPGEMFHNLP